MEHYLLYFFLRPYPTKHLIFSKISEQHNVTPEAGNVTTAHAQNYVDG